MSFTGWCQSRVRGEETEIIIEGLVEDLKGGARDIDYSEEIVVNIEGRVEWGIS